MNVIENFAALSIEEQTKFAEALLKTINSEKIFSDDTNFELAGVSVYDITGELMIDVNHTEPILVSRKATWTCAEVDDAEDDPGFEADYEVSIYKDAQKAFKTLSAVIDGYAVSLKIEDVNTLDGEAEISVDQVSEEDSGIGDYEYAGSRGYDSRPYCEVSGTIIRPCEYAIYFSVEPAVEEPTPEVE